MTLRASLTVDGWLLVFAALESYRRNATHPDDRQWIQTVRDELVRQLT